MCLLMFSICMMEHALYYARFNTLTQIICLWDGIPYVFKALVLPWFKRCHGNIYHLKKKTDVCLV